MSNIYVVLSNMWAPITLKKILMQRLEVSKAGSLVEGSIKGMSKSFMGKFVQNNRQFLNLLINRVELFHWSGKLFLCG